MENRNHVEIPEKDVSKNLTMFHDLMKSFNHSVKAEGSQAGGRRSHFVAGMSHSSISERSAQVTLIKTINDVTPDMPIDTNQQHLIVTTLLKGLCIASAVTDIYAKQSGLQQLKDQNSTGTLPATEKSRFNECLSASSFIALQVTANFMLNKLGASESSTEIAPPESISYTLRNPLHAAKDILFALDSFIERNARDDDSLIAATKTFFDKLLDELSVQQSGLTQLAAVLGNEYFAKEDDFAVVIGEKTGHVKQTSFVMDFKTPQQVIGNAIAKYQSQKLAKMMMCYDFERQMNPFAQMGSFSLAFCGDGNPGTGKTTIIQMLAGLLHNYCEVADYPFYYENLSVEAVDSYQGKSAQNTKAFIRNVMNPNVIGFGTIDDIDQVAASRNDPKASSGAQEITSVLMNEFAGANTIVRGNAVFGMYSNYPEKVDDALRQRAGARYLIDGPQTHADFVDILALLLGDAHTIPAGEIELYVTQHIEKMVTTSYEKHNLPQEAKLMEVFDATIKQYGELDTLEKIGWYLKNIQNADDRFTGRAIKNITDAAKVRSMDVDLPDVMFEDPKVFLHRPYDEKMAMLMDFQNPITPQMLLQEVNRYADSEFRYSAKSDEQDINAIVRQHRIQTEARTRIQAGATGDE